MQRFRKLISLLFLIFFTANCMAEDILVLKQIDVGEGNATLLMTKSSSILIDSGPPYNSSKLVNILRKNSPAGLDALIITHPHQDHIGGVFQILDQIKVKRLYDNGQELESEGEPYRWFEDRFRKNTISKYSVLSRGEYLDFDKLQLKVLSPTRKKLDSDWNKNSLVIRVGYGNFCALLMADVIVETEKELLAAGKEDLKCKLVQIGHHGSSFSSSLEFVNSTKAETGIVSINEANFRGYPDKSTLMRWKDSGTKLYTTYESGSITIKAKTDGSYAVQTEK